MDATVAIDGKAEALVEAALQGRLTEKQAEQLAKHLAGSELALVKFVLLAVVGRIAELSAKLEAGKTPDPSTPSGQVPIYTKPNISKRQRQPGAKPGHEGRRRPGPQQIDPQQTHRLERCPDCGGELQRCRQTRRRIIEDIPEDIRIEATEHTIHRDWCPRCKKHVEPVVPDALPKATMGHRTIARSEKGAATQAILMSVFRTLKLRGHHPIDTLVSALKTYVTTGQLPTLPDPGTTDG